MSSLATWGRELNRQQGLFGETTSLGEAERGTATEWPETTGGVEDWATSTEEITEALGIPKDIPDSTLLEHITLQLSPRYCGKCGCQLKARWLQKKCFDRQTGYPKYDVIIACPHATLYETRISSKLLVIFESPFNRHTAGRVSLVIPPEADSVISNMGEEWAKNIHNNSLGIWSLILGIIGILTFSGLAGALAAIVLGILQFRHHVSKCSIAGVVLGVFGVVLFIVP